MRRRWTPWAAIVVAATALTAWGAGTDWDDVIKRLGSEQFAVREAAQKQLDKVPQDEYERLKALAAGEGDAEVRARLAGRVESLEEETAIDPAPISLKVQNASLAELSRSLSTALGVPLTDVYGTGEPPTSVRFTLEARDKPFWEVFIALNAQHPLNYGEGARVWWEGGYEGAGINWGQRKGGFLVYPVSTYRRRMTNAEGQSGQEEVRLEYRLLIDPRVVIVGKKFSRSAKVVDEKGNVLCDEMHDPRAQRGGDDWTFLGGLQESSPSALLKLPADHGKTIASFTGTEQFLVGVGRQKQEMDIERVGREIVMANTRVNFWDVSVVEGENGNVVMTFGATANADRPPGETPMPIGIRLVDGAERVLWDGGSWRYEKRVFEGPVKRPVKAILSAPVRAKEVKVPFEFKDLPLPLDENVIR